MGDTHSYAAASRRIQAWMLGAWVVLVLSASLYPFNFDPARFLAAAADGFQGLRTWRPTSQRDTIVNLLVYVPIGLLIPLVLGPRRRAAVRWMVALAAARCCRCWWNCCSTRSAHACRASPTGC